MLFVLCAAQCSIKNVKREDLCHKLCDWSRVWYHNKQKLLSNGKSEINHYNLFLESCQVIFLCVLCNFWLCLDLHRLFWSASSCCAIARTYEYVRTRTLLFEYGMNRSTRLIDFVKAKRAVLLINKWEIGPIC